jgi:hypothetical protein
MQLRASPLVDAYGRRVGRPVPPVEIADAVERWARQWGRHARLEWNANTRCFCIHFTRKGDDPVLAAVQAGRRGEVTESVMLHEWKKDGRAHPFIPGQKVGGFVPMDLEQYGVEGIVRMLDKSNMWSGRGEFSSPQDALDAVTAQNEKRERDVEAQVEGAARERANLIYRKVTGNPQVGVIADLRPKARENA